jgi:hypothetical protein
MAEIDIALSPYFVDFMCLFESVVSLGDDTEDMAMSDAPTESHGAVSASSTK